MASVLPIETRSEDSRQSSERLRVVHLVLTLNIGGLEKVVYDLVRSTDRGRIDVHIVCLGEVGSLGPSFDSLNVPVESLDVARRGPIAGILRLAARLRALRPDVLHTHNASPHLIGAPAAWLSGVPVVVHTRHGRHLFSGLKSRLVNRLASRLTQRIVAVSEDAADVSRMSDGIPDEKLEVIWNGIELREFSERTIPVAAVVHRAIHVARLADDIKDQQSLLHAARIVTDAEPRFELDLVGDGPDRAMLEALRDELGLQSNVKFHGYRLDVRSLLSQAGLFVLSSVTEGLSISVLEAMAASLPVVATNVGGNPEVVANGTTGIIVPPRNPSVLAASMLELIRNPRRAEQMGRAGRERVEEHFDLCQVAAKYERIYRRLSNR